MIRTVLMLAFWAIMLPIAALLCFPWVLITRDIRPLYRIGMWAAFAGVRLAGVKVQTVGLELLDPSAKRELFRYPILGRAMRMASLVPVDRGNRDAGIAAVRSAAEVVKQGIHMTIYVEGHRSFDGKLLPFKKGPFYLTEECQAPVVPITIAGTHYVMPKRRFAIKPGTVTVTFHKAIEPAEFGTRDNLMEKVRAAINTGLPPEYQS